MIQAPGYKDMLGTNILAYLGRFEVAKKSKCVCHSKPSHPSLMFVGKAGAYPSEAPFT
jgi:hypothetical protein